MSAFLSYQYMRWGILLLSGLYIYLSCSSIDESHNSSIHVEHEQTVEAPALHPPIDSLTDMVDNKGLKTGDIIFQTSLSSQSQAIQLATNSEFSHVGVVFISERDTQVLEAVQPVKYTSFKEFVDRGLKDEYHVKRLKDQTIDMNKASLLKTTGDQYVGLNYDWLFHWNDEKLYCSELVYKLYLNVLKLQLCEPRPLKDYSLNSQLVRSKLKERYGANLPLDELMVSPEDIYQSEYLIEVKH